MLHGDLQISKGDGNHLCGVDEQPLADGIYGLERHHRQSRVQMSASMPGGGDICAVCQMEHRSGTVPIEGEGRLRFILEIDLQIQG